MLSYLSFQFVGNWHIGAPFRLLQAAMLAETVLCSIFVCQRQVVAGLVPWARGRVHVINSPWAHKVLGPPLPVGITLFFVNKTLFWQLMLPLYQFRFVSGL